MRSLCERTKRVHRHQAKDSCQKTSIRLNTILVAHEHLTDAKHDRD